MGNTPEIKFRGEVLSGRGEAKGFLEIDWVREQCSIAAGFEPYPGTLNLKVDAVTFALIRRSAMSYGKRIIPPLEAEAFCEARLLPLFISGISGAIIYPMMDDYYSNIIEVIAPMRLKERKDIRDGNFLEAVLPPLQKLFSPAAVIFDLDGTLIDSVELYYSILCEGCRCLGEKPPQRDVFLDFMGKGLGFWEVWAMVTGRTPAKSVNGETEKKVMAVFEDIWQRRYEQEVGLFPGVRELLVQMHERNIKMGVVTSSFYLKKMDLFRKAGLEPDQIFTSVITLNETVHRKPHSEPMFGCLEKLAVPATRCFCVGDSPCDILAGRETGLFNVGVLSGAGTVQSLSKAGADALLDSVADLTALTG